MKGKRMRTISFEPTEGKFSGFFPMAQFLGGNAPSQASVRKAVQLYRRFVQRAISLVAEIEYMRAERKLIPARTVWKLGDMIFAFRDGMSVLGFEIDGLYEHLVRDLGVKRKWVEKVVILRRYVPTQQMIPASLNWGRCEKGTRRVAESLAEKAKQG